MAHGIFYRSDTRWPHTYAELFKYGFQKRDTSFTDPEMRHVAGGGMDVEPNSAVCITRDLFAAPIFPVSKLWAEPWVYVLDLELSKVFNTQMRQYQEAVNVGGEDAMWPMFGQERAVNEVLPTEIIGAFLVERKFHGKSWETGGTFKPVRYKANPRYSRNPVNARRVKEAYDSLADKEHAMPTITSGYVKVEKPAAGPPPVPPKLPKAGRHVVPPVTIPYPPKIASDNAPPPPVPPKIRKV